MAELNQACCSTDAQATCCDPADKNVCCDPGLHAEGACGCAAGTRGESDDDVREAVRARYAAAARGTASAAAVSLTDRDGAEVFGNALYGSVDTDGATAESVSASLGCGVPTAVADLHEGETVLDLGSGAGVDVLISAKRVGPTGRVYGLDMTDEMLDLARANAAEAGASNVEFLKGYLEAIPLADATVDVVISNCVINLAGDKQRVLVEAARVLRLRWPVRRKRRGRRPRYGRRHQTRHAAMDRLHRRRPDPPRI